MTLMLLGRIQGYGPASPVRLHENVGGGGSGWHRPGLGLDLQTGGRRWNDRRCEYPLEGIGVITLALGELH